VIRRDEAYMYIRSILLASFIFVLTLTFVQLDSWVEACVLTEQSETTESNPLNEEPSLFEDSFVRSFRTNDVSQNKALGCYDFQPNAFVEIRPEKVYLLDTCFLC
jgi:hypothetical protein